MTYDGDIFVASGSSNFMGKLDASGNIIWEKPLPTGFDPGNLECDMNGNIYISGNDFSVRKFDNDGNSLWATTLPTTNVFYPIEVTAMSGSYKWG